MDEKTRYAKDSVEKTVRDIRRRTRRKFSAEEKIRIVLEGLRGEDSIAELCRKEGINQNLYYRWSKDFLEAGKKRLSGGTSRQANTEEVKNLRHAASGLDAQRLPASSVQQTHAAYCLKRKPHGTSMPLMSAIPVNVDK